MNALTEAAINRIERNCRNIAIQNIIIAAICGVTLGLMLGVAV